MELTDSEMQTSISWRWSQAAEESQLSAEVDELYLHPNQALKWTEMHKSGKLIESNTKWKPYISSVIWNVTY